MVVEVTVAVEVVAEAGVIELLLPAAEGLDFASHRVFLDGERDFFAKDQ